MYKLKYLMNFVVVGLFFQLLVNKLHINFISIFRKLFSSMTGISSEKLSKSNRKLTNNKQQFDSIKLEMIETKQE